MVFLSGRETFGLAEVHVEVWVSRADSGETDQQGAIVASRLKVEVLELTFLDEATHWGLGHQLLEVSVDDEVVAGRVEVHGFGVFFLHDRWR